MRGRSVGVRRAWACEFVSLWVHLGSCVCAFVHVRSFVRLVGLVGCLHGRPGCVSITLSK